VSDQLNVVKISGVDQNRGVSVHEICEAMEGNNRGLRISKNHLMPFEKGALSLMAGLVLVCLLHRF
jgi:hypothetical protein